MLYSLETWFFQVYNPHIKVMIKNVDDHHDHGHVSQRVDSLKLSLAGPDH